MTESTPKKIIAVDLFCGAGGLTTGLKAAGIDVVGGVEFDSDAANTYRANHPHSHLFQQDIKSLSGNDILKTLGVAKIDLLAGCPPCQGFSSLTFKNKKEDPRNFLILEFLRLVRELNPQVIMLENVPGWATRSVGDFSLLPIKYEEVPAFLTNGKKEFALEKNQQIVLNRKEYLYIVQLLNKLINHINLGRIAKNEDQIELFEEPNIPDDNILRKTKQTVQDFMDKDIVEYWDTYVVSNLEDYLKKRYPPKDNIPLAK